MMSCGPKTALRNLQLTREMHVDLIMTEILHKFRQLNTEEKERVLNTIRVHLQIEVRK
jgi:hypothetical protein